MIHIVQEIAARYGLTRKGEKWVGKCPKCGGSDTTDRFNIRDDGGFKCYSCGDFKGDIITWLREMDGKSCPEAHQEAGIECKVGAGCPVWDTCRMGSGKGIKTARRPRQVDVPTTGKAPALPSARPGGPDPAWEAWATETVARASAALPGQKAAMTWLRSRGIDQAAVERFRLGWLQRDIKVNRAAIGLTPEKNGRTELWVPSGLLIPVLDREGRIHRLRVRRPGWARQKFLPDLKYVWLEGSGAETMAIVPRVRIRGAVICEAELDAMACAAAHHEVLAVALGTVRGGLTAELRRLLDEAPVILVALDADPGKDGKPGPGPDAVQVWLREYRQARFWPVPAGKDPGDYVKEHSGNLLVWLEAGLPPAVSHEPMSCPGGKKSEGGGAVLETGYRKQESEGKMEREGEDMATDAVVIPAVEPGEVPLEQEPEVVELLGLLREHRAWVVVEGRELRAWFPELPAAMYEANRGGRRRIRELLYTGAVVPYAAALLPPGKYDAAGVARFVGR